MKFRNHSITGTVAAPTSIIDVRNDLSDNWILDYEYDPGEPATSDSPGMPAIFDLYVYNKVTGVIYEPSKKETQELESFVLEHITRLSKFTCD